VQQVSELRLLSRNRQRDAGAKKKPELATVNLTRNTEELPYRARVAQGCFFLESRLDAVEDRGGGADRIYRGFPDSGFSLESVLLYL
jgi:hypothetical protein